MKCYLPSSNITILMLLEGMLISWFTMLSTQCEWCKGRQLSKHKISSQTQIVLRDRNEIWKHFSLIPKLVFSHTAHVEYLVSEGWNTHVFFTAFDFPVKSLKSCYSCIKTHLSGPWLGKVSNQLQLKKKIQKVLERRKGKCCKNSSRGK